MKKHVAVRNVKEFARGSFMKGIGCIAVFALLVCCIGSGCSNKTEGEPDLLNSFSMNRDENLVVIANRYQIEDKDEFASLLVRMCKENSFHSIKFSTDRGYATSLDMCVYLWRDEVEGNDPVMTVEYKPEEWNHDYDIINNPEEFRLYVDGELIENQ